MAKIQFDAGIIAPLQRHLINGDGALAAAHRGMVVIGGIKMRAVVRGQAQGFHRPAVTCGQVFFCQSGEISRHHRRGVGMGMIVDFGMHLWWVGFDCRVESN